MLATMINAVALQSAFKQKGLLVRLMSRLNIQRIGESYNMQKGEAHLNKGHIVIIGGGTSNPCFITLRPFHRKVGLSKYSTPVANISK